MRFLKKLFPYLAVAIATYLASRSLGKGRKLEAKAEKLKEQEKLERRDQGLIKAEASRKKRDDSLKAATAERNKAQQQIDSIEDEDMRALIDRWNK